MHIIINLLEGILAGLMASAPLGPIGVLCIQRTLANGRLSGFVSGMGAASADTIFAVLAIFSLTFINKIIQEYNFWVEVIGGIIVIIFGMSIYFKHVKKPHGNKISTRNKANLITNYITVFFLTLPNPAYFLVFVWIFAAMGIATDTASWSNNIAILSGVLIGATIWWFSLTLIINKLRAKFNYRGLWWLNKISGGLIMLIGVWTVIKVILSLIPNLHL